MGYVGVLAFVIFAQGLPGASIVTPPQPPAIQNHVDVTLQTPPPDKTAIGDAGVWTFQAITVDLIAPTLLGWANDALNVPDLWRTTPPEWTVANSGVRGMAEILRTVALGLLPLAILTAGIMRALGQGGIEGRVFYALVLSIGNLSFWGVGINLNNAICQAIAAPSIAEIARKHLEGPTLTANPAEAFGPAVLVIVYAVVLLLLLFSLAFRLGLLDLLIVVGSVLLFCKATEQTDGLMSRYQQLAVGTLFSQVLIVVALKLAPVLGIVGGGFIGSILGVVVLLLARRMPTLFSAGHAEHSSGGLLRFLSFFPLFRRFL